MPRSDSSAEAAKLAELLPPAAVDALLADAEASGMPVDGPDGLLAQLTKSVLERALDVERWRPDSGVNRPWEVLASVGDVTRWR